MLDQALNSFLREKIPSCATGAEVLALINQVCGEERQRRLDCLHFAARHSPVLDETFISEMVERGAAVYRILENPAFRPEHASLAGALLARDLRFENHDSAEKFFQGGYLDLHSSLAVEVIRQVQEEEHPYRLQVLRILNAIPGVAQELPLLRELLRKCRGRGSHVEEMARLDGAAPEFYAEILQAGRWGVALLEILSESPSAPHHPAVRKALLGFLAVNRPSRLPLLAPATPPTEFPELVNFALAARQPETLARLLDAASPEQKASLTDEDLARLMRSPEQEFRLLGIRLSGERSLASPAPLPEVKPAPARSRG